MDIKDILALCDHTLLAPDATWDDIRTVIDDGIKYGTASVCIPPSFVARAKEYAGGRVPITTVIGFPLGYAATQVKVWECACAIEAGADEIDMVINIGALKDKDYERVAKEIELVKTACHGKTLKVIIETCLLTEAEKIIMCDIVSKSGADFIKTSTGFSTGGASFEDISLFKQHLNPRVRIKAAGGISSLADAEEFIRLGADRLGTSRIVKIAKSDPNATGY
ncbi:MAG: deoxyribose-phosphate aldolase [Clostridia bacterium]|nr:deoxyribose-phosphate aldolase [Clostridia bacterium]